MDRDTISDGAFKKLANHTNVPEQRGLLFCLIQLLLILTVAVFVYILCPVRQDGSSSTEGEGAVQEKGSVHSSCREETD